MLRFEIDNAWGRGISTDLKTHTRTPPAATALMYGSIDFVGESPNLSRV